MVVKPDRSANSTVAAAVASADGGRRRRGRELQRPGQKAKPTEHRTGTAHFIATHPVEVGWRRSIRARWPPVRCGAARAASRRGTWRIAARCSRSRVSALQAARGSVYRSLAATARRPSTPATRRATVGRDTILTPAIAGSLSDGHDEKTTARRMPNYLLVILQRKMVVTRSAARIFFGVPLYGSDRQLGVTRSGQWMSPMGRKPSSSAWPARQKADVEGDSPYSLRRGRLTTATSRLPRRDRGPDVQARRTTKPEGRRGTERRRRKWA
jgi:hypothetical protein